MTAKQLKSKYPELYTQIENDVIKDLVNLNYNLSVMQRAIIAANAAFLACYAIHERLCK